MTTTTDTTETDQTPTAYANKATISQLRDDSWKVEFDGGTMALPAANLRDAHDMIPRDCEVLVVPPVESRAAELRDDLARTIESAEALLGRRVDMPPEVGSAVAHTIQVMNGVLSLVAEVI